MCSQNHFSLLLLISCLFTNRVFGQDCEIEGECSTDTNDGNIVTIKQAAYMAGLLQRDAISGKERLICTSVIVGKRFTLSAAHCFNWEQKELSLKDEKIYRIRSNSDNWTTEGDTKTHEVVKYRIYNPSTSENLLQRYFRVNIAVIMIKDTFDGIYERPIPIAPPTTNFLKGKKATSISWEAVNSLYHSRLKQQFNVVANFYECSRFYKNDLNIIISPDMICAYSFRKGNCYGDSGGPLIQNKKVIAMASFGRECVGDHTPDVYTKVYTLYYWIESQMGELQNPKKPTLDEDIDPEF